MQDIPLPASVSKAHVLLEGMINLDFFDDESTIKKNLTELLKSACTDPCRYTPEKLVFLSFSSKILCQPHVTPGFQWSGESIKANIGQGKLYVMLKDEPEQV